MRSNDATQNKRSIPSLDGLRGIAVLLVIVAHLGWMSRAADALASRGLGRMGWLVEFDAGKLGVSEFFVISGFLITTLLLREMDRTGRISLRDFYTRRFFRIFPPYYVYLLVVAVLWAARVVAMPTGAWLSAATYFSNYYPYRLSLPAAGGWLVGHTWSLSLEEQFYLVWPACLVGLGRRRAAWLGVAAMLLAPVARIATLHLFPGTAFDGQVARMFHTRIDTIMAGCVLGLLGTAPRFEEWLARNVKHRWTGAAAALLLFAALHASSRSPDFELAFGLGLEAVLLAYLTLFAIAQADSRGGRVLNHRALRRIGIISYSLYLWQQLFDGASPFGRGHLVLRLAAIWMAAEISYRVVERASFSARDRCLARGTRVSAAAG